MNPTAADLDRLLGEAWRMPYGRAQVAAVEEVIRHADAQRLAPVQYAARILAISAYTYSGERAKSFVPFAWCLAVYDRGEADPHYDHSLMWAFKHVVSGLTGFPEVPLERTYAVLDDMERRYRLAGHSMNPVHMLRTEVADHVGDAATAAEQYRLWCGAPRGELSDCVGCEPSGKAAHLLRAGRYDDALAVAEPVLTGALNCVEQPAAILTKLLVPYVRAGRYTEAADAHRRAYRQSQASRSDLGRIAEHVAFCARTGNLPRALELVQRHVGWLDEPSTPMSELTFSASAAHALRRVDGDVPVAGRRAADLGEELAARALALAERFDARNGTSAVGDRTRERLDAEPLADALPLSGVARRRASAPPPPVPAAVPELATTPADLVEQAHHQGALGNEHLVTAVWARFDELCPEPAGVLRGERLIAAGTARAHAGDLDDADELWATAAEVLTGIDDVIAASARQRRGLARCVAGDVEDGLARVEAEAAILASAGDPARRIGSARRLAQALHGAHRHDEAVESARAALAIAEEAAAGNAGAGAVAWHAGAALFLARLLAVAGPDHNAEATAFADLAIALLAPLEPAEERHEAQLVAGRLRAVAGRFDEAYALLGDAARSVVGSRRAEALGLRGRVAFRLERPAEAAIAFSDAVAALETDGNPRGAGHARVELARALLATEALDEATEALEEAIGALTPDDADTLLEAKQLLAECYVDLRLREQAVELLDETAEQFAARGEHDALGRARGIAADVLDQLDRDEAAANHYEQAADAFAAAGEPGRHLHNRRRAALSWHWAGQPERSLAALEVAVALGDTLPADEAWVSFEVGMARYDGARILSALGRSEEAAAHAARSVELFGAIDATAQVVAARTLHGRILADLGRAEEARAVLTEARDALPPEATDRRDEITALIGSVTPG